MTKFAYLARDPGGRLERGTIEAGSPAAARAGLGGRGLRLVRLDAVPEPGLGTVDLLERLHPTAWLPPRSLDIETAAAQLAVLLRGGLTLLAALRTAAEQSRKVSMRRVLNDVADRIQQGTTFAEALQQHRCFPPLVVQLVRVGEQTGTLDQVLTRAAKQLEERRLLMTNLITALAYPAFVAVAAIGVAVYLVVAVIPELQKFLSVLGRELPPMTQLLVDISIFVQTNGPAILIGLIAAIAAAVLIYQWPPGRMTVDRWSLRIPVIGPVLRLAGTASFASAMSVLIRSGITVLEALRTAEGLHRNRFLAECVAQARESVLQGGGLASALGTRGAYLPMLSKMIAVAENTGDLDEILDHVARFHESQLQIAIKRLSALIEPAIILVVGGIVGFVYISFFVALYSAGGGFR